MIPINQKIIDPYNSDALRATVATVCEMNYDDVPQFVEVDSPLRLDYTLFFNMRNIEVIRVSFRNDDGKAMASMRKIWEYSNRHVSCEAILTVHPHHSQRPELHYVAARVIYGQIHVMHDPNPANNKNLIEGVNAYDVHGIDVLLPVTKYVEGEQDGELKLA